MNDDEAALSDRAIEIRDWTCECERCERAAIFEYDAGMSREAAEVKAGIRKADPCLLRGDV